MRIAYLDCFAGISGDMFLAALLDSGLEPGVLHEAAAALNVTDRCIRKWAKTGRLRAVLAGSRWLIDQKAISVKHIT